MSESSDFGPVGIVIVHGVGKQEPERALNDVIAGLSRFAEVEHYSVGDNKRISVNGTPVNMYEAHWADLLSGTKIERTFSAGQYLSAPWFPWLNLKHGKYKKGDYSRTAVVMWTMALIPLSLLLCVAYFGLRFFYLFAHVCRSTIGRIARDESQAPEIAVNGARRIAGVYLGIDRLLDEYVGDVFNYVNSTRQHFPREPIPRDVADVFPPIVTRFHDALLKAYWDECARIVVVAHSLGTVVMFHAIFGISNRDTEGKRSKDIDKACQKIDHVFTMGSPLEKIRFIWPEIICYPTRKRIDGLMWKNFISRFDLIAGKLRRFDRFADQLINRPLLGGGFITGHIAYERNRIFVAELVSALTGKGLLRKRSFGERAKDFTLLLGESLLAPAALLGVSAIGGAYYVIGAIIISFELRTFSYIPFIPTMSLETQNGLTVSILIYLFLVVLIVGRLLAVSYRFRKEEGIYDPWERGIRYWQRVFRKRS